jgi:hypothetical protein
MPCILILPNSLEKEQKMWIEIIKVCCSRLVISTPPMYSSFFITVIIFCETYELWSSALCSKHGHYCRCMQKIIVMYTWLPAWGEGSIACVIQAVWSFQYSSVSEEWHRTGPVVILPTTPRILTGFFFCDFPQISWHVQLGEVCTNPRHHIANASEFFTMVLNVCGSSVTLLVLRIWRWHLDFLENMYP